MRVTAASRKSEYDLNLNKFRALNLIYDDSFSLDGCSGNGQSAAEVSDRSDWDGLRLVYGPCSSFLFLISGELQVDGASVESFASVWKRQWEGFDGVGE